MRKITILIGDLMRGLGAVLIASPLALYWFIHGDYDRYIWIINGPAPFDSFGSGPFQLWMFIGLIVCGFFFMALSGRLKKEE
ncbi:MAG: hypothetical protein JJE29_08865 [Peptostreptococcaceae bacterium]|nr:hypothetical protein [Peptostreptococcaceae bacterium]